MVTVEFGSLVGGLPDETESCFLESKRIDLVRFAIVSRKSSNIMKNANHGTIRKYKNENKIALIIVPHFYWGKKDFWKIAAWWMSNVSALSRGMMIITCGRVFSRGGMSKNVYFQLFVLKMHFTIIWPPWILEFSPNYLRIYSCLHEKLIKIFGEK